MNDHIHDHDRGLAHDLEVMARQVMARRHALRWFAGAGASALLVGCGGGETTGATSSTASGSTTTTTTTGSTTTGSTSSGTCVADPTETAGPFPADGTNTASGSTSNVLTQGGVVRRDIRPSFVSSSTVAAGVRLDLTLTLVNVNASCAPLSGYAIYLWHCDATGNYSLYDIPAESYLRGVQVTDANGQVTFTTIYPGCYSGRYPHMHFEVFASLSAASTGRNARLTSQLAMPADVSTVVYAAGGYGQSTANAARVTIASDGIFGDNTAAQVAAQTPALTGSVANGYTGTATIGIAI